LSLTKDAAASTPSDIMADSIGEDTAGDDTAASCCVVTPSDIMADSVGEDTNLHNAEWTDHISSPAVTTFKVRKQHTVVDLPSTSDLLKLKEYSEMKMSQLVQQLSVHPTYNIWRELSEIVLSRLVVFNKRRSSQHSF